MAPQDPDVPAPTPPGRSLADGVAGAAFGLRDAVAGGIAGARGLGWRVVEEVTAPAVDSLLRHLAESRQLDELIRAKVTALLPQLVADPAVAALVREQIERVLSGLVGHALVTELVRTQAEAVIEHLRSNPDALEAVVSGQGQRFLGERKAILRRKTAAAAGVDLALLDEIRNRREAGESLVAIATRRLRRGLRALVGGGRP